jgi:hypothetical protein
LHYSHIRLTDARTFIAHSLTPAHPAGRPWAYGVGPDAPANV